MDYGLMAAVSDQPQPFRWIVREAREHRIQLPRAEMLRDHFAEHRSEIGGEGEISAFVQLLRLEARPAPEHLLATVDIAADDEQCGGVTVIGSTVPILTRRAA